MSKTGFTGTARRAHLYSDAAELKLKLNQLYETNQLPLYQGRVARTKLAVLLNIPEISLVKCSNSLIWAEARKCVDEFDGFLADRDGVWCAAYSDIADLRKKLLQLYDEGELPVVNGKVSRKSLAKMLGMPSDALQAQYSQKVQGWEQVLKCVDGFDDYLGQKGYGSRWQGKIPEIRKHLMQLSASGTLPVNFLGKLNRNAILQNFTPNTFSASALQKRYPGLKKLFAEYDEIIENGNYSRYKYDYIAKDLAGVLSSPDVPLVFGRKVSVTKIGELLGIHANAIQTTPRLWAMIQAKQEEVDRSLKHGKAKNSFVIGGTTYINVGLKPWSKNHNRIFDFSELITPYGQEFAEKVGTIFLHVSEGIRHSQAIYSRLKHFLIWLSTYEGSHDVVESFKADEMPNTASFERSLLIYKQWQLEQCGGIGRRRLNGFSILQKLSVIGFFPRVRAKQTGRVYRAARKDSSPKPSLVEAQARDEKAVERLLEESALYRGIEFEYNTDTVAFANNLAMERAGRDDLPEDLVEAIAHLCAERLYELRVQATKSFKQWYEAYEIGQELIAQARFNGKEILQELQGDKKSHSYREKISEIFPKKDTEESLRNLLVLLHDEFNSVCVNASNHEFGLFWTRVFTRAGGVQNVQRYLLPDATTVSSAVCLYLCESGANTEVGRALGPKSLRQSKLPGHINFVAPKGRSKGKSIYYDLPKKTGDHRVMSAAEAFEILTRVTQSLRDNKLIKADDLLVFANLGSLKTLSGRHLTDGVRGIVSESAALSGLVITPSMIRPTVLLLAQLRNPGDLSAANLIAQHLDMGVTMGYVAKLPYRMILEERIRRFQETLEVVIADRIHHAKANLDIDNDAWKDKIAHAQNSGLGMFFENYHNDTKITGAADDVPYTVVATPELIADIIIWKESLAAVQDEWLETRTNRWEEVWVPVQAFFEVVLQKISRGELARIKQRATELVNTRKSSSGFQLPQPW